MRTRTDPHGQRPAKPRYPAPHGTQCHAEGWLEGSAARQVSAGRMGQCLSHAPPRPILKCNCPVQDRADVSKRAVKMHVLLFKAATEEGQPPLMQPLKTL